MTDRKALIAASFVMNKRVKSKPKVDKTENLNDIKPLMDKDKLTVEKVEQMVRESKAQKVPSTRLARMATFGALGLSLGLGTVAEASRRAIGISKVNPNNGKAKLDGNLILSEANAERIVETLCKVRGAALKIGQIISIQDESLINPQVAQIFERVCLDFPLS